MCCSTEQPKQEEITFVDAFSTSMLSLEQWFHIDMKDLTQTCTNPLRIIALLMKTKLRPRLIYAPCIPIGAVVSFLAGFVVGHMATFAARRSWRPKCWHRISLKWHAISKQCIAMQYIAKLKQHQTLQTQSVEQCGTSCNCRIQSERGLEVMAICRRWLCGGFAYMSDFVWVYEDWAFAGHMDMQWYAYGYVKHC